MKKNEITEFKDTEVLYSIFVNSNKEIIDGFEYELCNYIYNYNKFDKNFDSIINLKKECKCIDFKTYIDFGISALSILDNKDFFFPENINNELSYLRTYINKCIKNEKYCNSTLFLAYVKDVLHRFLPPCQYNTQNLPYSERQIDENILNTDNNSKLEAMLFNIYNIELRKDYICTGIIDLIICSLFEIFSKNYNIKKCQNCNRYFISKKSDKRIKYCNYYFSSEFPDLTCRKLKLNSDYVQKRKNNALRSKYGKLYNKYNNSYLRLDEKYRDTDKPIEIELEIKRRLTIVKKLQELYNENIRHQVKKGELTESEAIKMLENFDKEEN